MNRLLLLFALLVSSCNNGTVNGTDAAVRDSSAPPVDQAVALDLASAPDLAVAADLSVLVDLATPPDQGRPVDLSGPGCKSDLDCRLFSNMCANAMPCTCIPLPVGAPDPVCVGPMVNCFMDPCANKKPACDLQTRTCIAK